MIFWDYHVNLVQLITKILVKSNLKFLIIEISLIFIIFINVLLFGDVMKILVVAAMPNELKAIKE